MTIGYRGFHNRISEVEIGGEKQYTKTGLYYRFGKRALDICIVLLSLPIVLPVIAVSAFLIMLDGASPFYAQERVGQGNRIFWIWKLRSMVPNAKEALTLVLKNNRAARLEWEDTQKLKSDPRITWFGRFIRKFSVDELPQIWNVLRGDMSIVGPRPMMPEQRTLYLGRSYFRLRPGITGLWQISDRNNSSFSARSDFDRTYSAKVSAKTDLLIILSTVKVVWEGTGY